MALIEYDIFDGKVDRVQVAIERLQTFEPPEGYYLAFSGGKDSITVYRLAEMSGVKFDAHFNLTTVDPPELVYFIRENYPTVEVHKPKMSMWQLIPTKLMPPSRMVRYCCQYLKEGGGNGRNVITGIRQAEGSRRKNRRLFEICRQNKTKHFLNPIIDWLDKDVWDFIHQQKLKYCKLYDEGYKRIGCILCPLANKKSKEEYIKKYPKYYQAYLRAFGRMLEERDRRGLETVAWETAQEVMDWWISDKDNTDPDQTVMFE